MYINYVICFELLVLLSWKLGLIALVVLQATLATTDTSCESVVTSGQHHLTPQHPPRDASPAGLVEFLLFHSYCCVPFFPRFSIKLNLWFLLYAYAYAPCALFAF